MNKITSFILLCNILKTVAIGRNYEDAWYDESYDERHATLEKSESTIRNEMIIISLFLFFILWLLFPFAERVLQILKELNDSYHFQTDEDTTNEEHQNKINGLSNEINELKQHLTDNIMLNRHRFQDYKEMNAMHQKEINIIYRRVSKLEEKFTVMVATISGIYSKLEDLEKTISKSEDDTKSEDEHSHPGYGGFGDTIVVDGVEYNYDAGTKMIIDSRTWCHMGVWDVEEQEIVFEDDEAEEKHNLYRDEYFEVVS